MVSPWVVPVAGAGGGLMDGVVAIVAGGRRVAEGSPTRLSSIFSALSGRAFQGARAAGLAAFETHADYLDVAGKILGARFAVGDPLDLVADDGAVLDHACIGVVREVGGA